MKKETKDPGKRLTRRQFIRGATALAALGAVSSYALPIEGRNGRIGANAGAGRTSGAPPRLLLDALRSDDPVVTADAARLLGDLGSRDAVAALVEYVTHSRYYAKTAGFDALARIGDPECCARIRPLARAPNVPEDDFWYGYHSVALFAAAALLSLGDASGEDVLLDESVNVRNWAFNTWLAPTVLRLPDDLPAVRRVKARVTVEGVLPPGKSDPGQLAYVTDSLGLLGGAEARVGLVRLCGYRSRYVRGRAALNLLRMSSAGEDLDRVRDIAANDAALFARIKAAEALAGGGRGDSVDLIASAVRTAASEFDRAAALDSLGIVGDAEHVGVVAPQLRSADPYVRLCAVAAMDRLGVPAAIQAVAAVQGDPDLRVRLHAAKCLAAHA